MSQCADICNSRLGLVCNLLWITAYLRMEAASGRGMEAVFNVCWMPFFDWKNSFIFSKEENGKEGLGWF